MIIDFHTHIFPRKVRENREKYFSDETEFSLLYSLPKSKLAGAQELVALMDAQGIDKVGCLWLPLEKPEDPERS